MRGFGVTCEIKNNIYKLYKKNNYIFSGYFIHNMVEYVYG